METISLARQPKKRFKMVLRQFLEIKAKLQFAPQKILMSAMKDNVLVAKKTKYLTYQQKSVLAALNTQS